MKPASVNNQAPEESNPASAFIELVAHHFKMIVLFSAVALFLCGYAAAKLTFAEELYKVVAYPLFAVLVMPVALVVLGFFSGAMWVWVKLIHAERCGWTYDTKPGWHHSTERGWYFQRRIVFPRWRYLLYDSTNPPVNWCFDRKPGWYYDGKGGWQHFPDGPKYPSWRYELYDSSNPPIMPAIEGVPLAPLGFADDVKTNQATQPTPSEMRSEHRASEHS